MILTGVFAKNVGLTSGETHTFIFHLLALVLVSIFTFTGSYLLYKVTDMILPMRVTPEQEEKGLDLAHHGEEAFDFRTK
jgi:Amt family ammonium transporter